LEVLGVLVEHAGSLVTREQLRERLWQVDTFVDFEHSLNTAIKRLRRVLDDDAENPDYVETVPRRGYRFIGKIKTDPLPADSLLEPLVGAQRVASRGESTSKPPHLNSRVGVLVVLALLLVASATWIGMRWSRRASQRTTSIAVLPFINATGSDKLDYLSDGISAGVIDKLSMLHNFDVIAWSLASRYRMKDPSDTGRDLKVDAVLSGSVKRDGDFVTIRTELLDPRSRRHLWGEEYTRNVADVRSLQLDITSDLVRRLGLQLSSEEKIQIAKQHTTDPKAYELYLKGRYYSAKGTREDLAKGLGLLQEATERDPKFALAYSGLAFYYFVAMDWIMPPREAHQKAKLAAEKALSLDPSLAEAQTMLGVISWLDEWNWSAAENHFQRAIELNPSYSTAHQFYGFFLASAGREDQALAEIRRALALDPLSLDLNNALGQVLCRGRRTQECLEQQQKTVELDPNFWFSRMGMGMSYLQAQNYPKAISELNEALRAGPNPDVLGALGFAYASSGDRQNATKVLAKLRDISAQGYVPPYDIALIHIGLGERDQAFEELRAAREERGFAVVWLNVSSDMDTLRTDSRFKSLVAPIGLSASASTSETAK
jgi:TolB-like protein/DNA-binding winged helix-turn-helix (wHTH) protein/Tfp pilus assembly protein PilF